MESCLLWCLPKRSLGMQSAFRGRPGEAGALPLLQGQGCQEREACGSWVRSAFRSGLQPLGERRVTQAGSRERGCCVSGIRWAKAAKENRASPLGKEEGGLGRKGQLSRLCFVGHSLF